MADPIDVTARGGKSPVTFSVSGLPDDIVLVDNGDRTATLEGEIASGASSGSPYTVTVTATDAAGLTASASFTWTVTV